MEESGSSEKYRADDMKDIKNRFNTKFCKTNLNQKVNHIYSTIFKNETSPKFFSNSNENKYNSTNASQIQIQGIPQMIHDVITPTRQKTGENIQRSKKE